VTSRRGKRRTPHRRGRCTCLAGTDWIAWSHGGCVCRVE